MIRFTTVAAACAIALSATSAFAASQSSASISGLTFTLIDLTPRDGIAPSFSFLSSTGSTALTISASDTALGESESAARTRPGTFSFTRDYLVELTNASSSASITSDKLTVSGAASGPQTSYSASASAGVINSSSYYYSLPLNLTLSANSLLLIDATFSLAASASNPSFSNSYYYSNVTESASASASLNLSYNYSAGGVSASYNGQQTRSLQASARGAYTDYTYGYDEYGYYSPIYTTYPKTEEDKTLSDTLTGVFTNASAYDQSASLGLSVSVSGQATTAPIVVTNPLPPVAQVPEPETLALGFGGLGVIALLARRRRRQA